MQFLDILHQQISIITRFLYRKLFLEKKMRKIVSKSDEEKKRRRNQFLIGGILILVMVLSVIGYSFRSENENSGNSEKIIYNGLEFAKINGFWTTKIGNIQFAFKYNPNETESINSQVNYLNNYTNKPLYISSENSESDSEIYKNLFYTNEIVQRVQYACLEGGKCTDESLPIKTCVDNFIIIKEKENNEVRQEKNCVFIEGKKEDLTKLTDSFLFKITGIQ